MAGVPSEIPAHNESRAAAGTLKKKKGRNSHLLPGHYIIYEARRVENTVSSISLA